MTEVVTIQHSLELEPTYRNAMGGYSSGYYLVMDENYTDIVKLL